MNTVIETILTLIIVAVIIILCYYYMNWARDQSLLFKTGKLKTAPANIPSDWILDAWDPTWTVIQRATIKLLV